VTEIERSAGQPGPALRPPALRVSKRAIGYWTARAAMGWLVFLAVGVIVLVTNGEPGWVVVTLVLAAVVAAVHLLVMPQWRYRVHRWEATDDAVYTQSGWFDQERRIAPVSRIQTVDSQRGPIEQIFGLANVTVTTASAAGPVKIHGLDLHDAQQLVDRLTRQTAHSTGDAT
jgi:uncharacterized protein